jgi:hypothetical protein
MKLLMIIGALLGFVIGSAFGFAGRAEWPTVFWHASAAALVSGLLMRWWGRVWTRNWRTAVDNRLAELEAQRRQAQSSTSQKA